jgi:hypothetical protein
MLTVLMVLLRSIGLICGWRRRKIVLKQISSADRGRRPRRIGRHRQNGSFAEQTETVLIDERDGSEMAAVDGMMDDGCPFLISHTLMRGPLAIASGANHGCMKTWRLDASSE